MAAVNITPTARTATQAFAPTATNPLTATLTDNFPGTAYDTTKWGSYGTVSVASNTLTVLATTAYSGLQATKAYSLFGSSFLALMTPLPVGTNQDFETGWALRCTRGSNSTGDVEIILGDGNLLTAYWHSATGANNKVATGITIPANPCWVRVRENGGTLYYEWSSDGLAWTTFASVADPPIALNNVYPELTSGHWSTETDTNATFQKVNLAPTPTAQNLTATASATSAATMAIGVGGIGVSPLAKATTQAAATVTAPVLPVLTPTATATTAAVTSIGINWSGYIWSVHPDASGTPPGPNNWRGVNVQFPGDGTVQLSITNQAGTWYCAELDGLQALGYGRYRWVVNSVLSSLDPNVVLGLFTYDSSNPPNYAELDIEAGWPDSNLGVNGAWSVQPVSQNDSMQERFLFSSHPPYTCDLTWQAGQVYFAVTDATGAVLHQHLCTDNVPTPGKAVVVMNLWLSGGNAPAAPVTITVNSFAFSPGATYTASPASSRAIFFNSPAPVYPSYGASISGGNLVLPCNSGTYSDADGDHIYNLIGSSMSADIGTLPPIGNGSTEAYFMVHHDSNNFLLADKSGNNVLLRVRSAGTNSDVQIAYNPSTMTFWRWRESGGNAIFETSPDTQSWTVQRSAAHNMAAQLQNVRARFQCGYYSTETSPGPLQVAAINFESSIKLSAAAGTTAQATVAISTPTVVQLSPRATANAQATAVVSVLPLFPKATATTAASCSVSVASVISLAPWATATTAAGCSVGVTISLPAIAQAVTQAVCSLGYANVFLTGVAAKATAKAYVALVPLGPPSIQLPTTLAFSAVTQSGLNLNPNNYATQLTAAHLKSSALWSLHATSTQMVVQHIESSSLVIPGLVTTAASVNNGVGTTGLVVNHAASTTMLVTA